MPENLIPDWVQSIARFNPVNWAVEAGRSAASQPHTDWTLVGSRVALLSALLLAGCSGGGEPTTYKIGYIGPVTGDAASYGADTLNAVQMKVDELNAAGGIGVSSGRARGRSERWPPSVSLRSSASSWA